MIINSLEPLSYSEMWKIKYSMKAPLQWLMPPLVRIPNWWPLKVEDTVTKPWQRCTVLHHPQMWCHLPLLLQHLEHIEQASKQDQCDHFDMISKEVAPSEVSVDAVKCQWTQ